ncbi:MAG: gamma-glutamyl-gamma-aminobutyrate hydrolase family protein [Bacteroidota bacterium]
MPTIGITIGKVFTDDRWRYQCPSDYVRAVLAGGGQPVLLPGAMILAAGEGVCSLCDGFLLSGGGDIDPCHYGQEPHPMTGPADRERDQAELALVRMAVAAGRPLLAICRGMQVLNVALGGDLIQDLPSMGYTCHDQTEPRSVRTHAVTPVQGTPLADLMPGSMPVNSFHHQAVGRLASGLSAAAHSPDGIIEAACLPGRPVLAVQWHPENYLDQAAEAFALFRWLSEQARTPGRSSIPAYYSSGGA